MAITKIKVRDFTVFNDLTIDIDAAVNIFIGENGTGKTQLLKFIYAIVQVLMKQDIRLGSFFGAKSSSELILFRRDADYPSAQFYFLHDGKEVSYLFNDATVHPAGVSANVQDSRIVLEGPSGVYCGIQGEQYLTEWWEMFVYDGPLEQLEKMAKNIVFIPAKDMLTHAQGLPAMKANHGNHMPFDRTLIDIINKASAWKLDKTPEIAYNIVPKLEKIMGGKIVIEKECFFIQKEDGEKIPFDIETEGVKKFGLLWQLLMNGSLTEGTILLWDEPEANINPKLIPVLAEIILELGRNGVQIFLATHDNFLAEYIEVLGLKSDKIAFHSLHKTDDGVKCETDEKFSMLEENSIINEKILLYQKATEKVLG